MAGAVLALMAGAPTAMAAAPAKSAAQSYTFAFQDAEVGKIVQEVLGNTLGIAYSIDPAVTGKMSFRIDQRLTRAQLFDAFEAALATNDIVMVRNGDALIVQPRSKAKSAPSLQADGERPHKAGYQTVAVPLSYATPSEVAKALASVASPSAVVSTDDKLGLIVLGGTDREIQALMQAVRVFDQSGLQANRIRFFELTRAPAQSVADEMDRLIQASGGSGVTIVPMKRLNGLYVFARTPQALDQVAQWVERLDVPPKETARAFHVYHPRSVSAEALSRSLAELLFGDGPTSGGPLNVANQAPASPGGAAPAAPGGAQAGPAPVLSQGPMSSPDGSTRLAVDKESNSLLVSASPADWVQIQRLLAEIDLPPKQILIEASILEVTLTDDIKAGVDWNWMASDSTNVINSSNSTGVIAPKLPGFAVTILNKDIKAAVSTLGTRASIEVVSAPKIMTLNNRSARLEIGDEVPITTQSAQSVTAGDSPIVNSVAYRSTGVILNVTPQITDEDNILLTVDQEVSNVSSTTSSDINSPTIQQRKFGSTVVLRNGGTVALGGLISTTRGKGSSGAPFLSAIPVIGTLFGTQTHTNDRSELIVLLNAQIISDQTSSDAAMANLMADLHEISSRGLVKRR